MRLRKECEHGRYDHHYGENPDRPGPICPGGEFLPEGALVIPRDVDGNWPLVLLDLLGKFGDPWSIQAVIETFVETSALASQVGESER